MGLNISDSKKGRKLKGKQVPQKKAKVEKSVKTKREQVRVDDDDEVVIAKPEVPMVTEKQVTQIEPFGCGLVHRSLRNGVNAPRRRSEESDLFGAVLSTVYKVDGVFFGAIYVKSSFAKRTGGSALL